jgi:hypothetical protein
VDRSTPQGGEFDWFLGWRKTPDWAKIGLIVAAVFTWPIAAYCIYPSVNWTAQLISERIGVSRGIIIGADTAAWNDR